MPLRFYFDDNCSDSDLVRGLRLSQIFVITSREADMYARPDADHLNYAIQHDLVLVTSDEKAFTRLSAEWLRAGRTHSGIVIIRQQRFTVREQIRALTSIHAEAGEAGLQDLVEFVRR